MSKLIDSLLEFSCLGKNSMQEYINCEFVVWVIMLDYDMILQEINVKIIFFGLFEIWGYFIEFW